MRQLTFIVLLMLSTTAMSLDATMKFDRTWGLQIGDLITASVSLPIEMDQLDTHSLPQTEKRYGAWLALNERVLTEDQLQFVFQVVNVPADSRVVAAPEFSFRTMAGEFITVTAPEIQLGSFLAKNIDTTNGLVPKQDVQAYPIALDALTQQRRIAIAVFVIAGIIWLVWQFGLRPRQQSPFAAVMLALMKMRFLGRRDVDVASRALHQAFNQSAKRVLVNSDLSVLWQNCPWLVPLKQDIEAFYQASAQHYFSQNQTQQRDFAELYQLAKRCRQREKMA